MRAIVLSGLRMGQIGQMGLRHSSYKISHIVIGAFVLMRI